MDKLYIAFDEGLGEVKSSLTRFPTCSSLTMRAISHIRALQLLFSVLCASVVAAQSTVISTVISTVTDYRVSLVSEVSTTTVVSYSVLFFTEPGRIETVYNQITYQRDVAATTLIETTVTRTVCPTSNESTLPVQSTSSSSSLAGTSSSIQADATASPVGTTSIVEQAIPSSTGEDATTISSSFDSPVSSLMATTSARLDESSSSSTTSPLSSLSSQNPAVSEDISKQSSISATVSYQASQSTADIQTTPTSCSQTPSACADLGPDEACFSFSATSPEPSEGPQVYLHLRVDYSQPTTQCFRAGGAIIVDSAGTIVGPNGTNAITHNPVSFNSANNCIYLNNGTSYFDGFGYTFFANDDRYRLSHHDADLTLRLDTTDSVPYFSLVEVSFADYALVSLADICSTLVTLQISTTASSSAGSTSIATNVAVSTAPAQSSSPVDPVSSEVASSTIITSTISGSLPTVSASCDCAALGSDEQCYALEATANAGTTPDLQLYLVTNSSSICGDTGISVVDLTGSWGGALGFIPNNGYQDASQCYHPDSSWTFDNGGVSFLGPQNRNVNFYYDSPGAHILLTDSSSHIYSLVRNELVCSGGPVSSSSVRSERSPELTSSTQLTTTMSIQPSSTITTVTTSSTLPPAWTESCTSIPPLFNIVVFEDGRPRSYLGSTRVPGGQRTGANDYNILPIVDSTQRAVPFSLDSLTRINTNVTVNGTVVPHYAATRIGLSLSEPNSARLK